MTADPQPVTAGPHYGGAVRSDGAGGWRRVAWPYKRPRIGDWVLWHGRPVQVVDVVTPYGDVLIVDADGWHRSPAFLSHIVDHDPKDKP